MSNLSEADVEQAALERIAAHRQRTVYSLLRARSEPIAVQYATVNAFGRQNDDGLA